MIDLLFLILRLFKVDCKLLENMVQTVSISRDHINDAQARASTHTTDQREQLKLELNRLEALYLTRDLRVAPAYEHLTLCIFLLVDLKLETHVVPRKVVQTESNPLWLL